MSEPKFYTVFEADSAYLKALGDTNTYFSEFEVRLKTLEALGGKIDDSITSLLEVEKKILETVGGIATNTNDIFELRKEIARAQGLDVDEDFNIWDVAQQEPPVGPPEDPNDITLPYVTFIAEEAGSTLGLSKLCSKQTLEYSTNKLNWNTLDTSSTVTLANVDDKVYVRGKLTGDADWSNYTKFKMTGKIAAYGNCNAIWNYEDLNAKLKSNCGYYMFDGCTSLTKTPKLPATTLSMSCYSRMFDGCTSLNEAPELPATTLEVTCYSGMFAGCTSLTEAPELPATTLALYCYQGMFQSCTSLTEAPELPATTLTENCYAYMFQSCTSLTEAPELPATTLANNCYEGMFSSCTSLAEAPELPATTLTSSCYQYMFSGCAVLTKTPELPATTLTENCYNRMFSSCWELKEIICLATDITATNCLQNWVQNVSSTGTFYKDPSMTSWTTGTSGIPEGWVIKNYGEPDTPEEDPADDLTLPYVTFRAEEAGSTVILNPPTANGASYFEYSFDKENWTKLVGKTYNNGENVITLNGVGDEVYVRAQHAYISGSSSGYTSSINVTGKVAAYGNIMALYKYQNLNEKMNSRAFENFFKNAQGLIKAPKLPSVDDPKYPGTFYGCTSLIETPELPATTIGSRAYYQMFYGCTSLTKVNEISVTKFSGYGACQQMFYGCTSLVEVPEILPATDLSGGNQQYSEMFTNCTSLTKAPKLPATTLTDYCYYGMFNGCTSLQEITCLATNISAMACHDYWVKNVASGGTFYKDPSMTSWPTGQSGIPSSWTVLDYAG